MKQKFDFKDITIVPEPLSKINSRKSIKVTDDEGYLPIFVSPMDTVVDYETQDTFVNSNLRVCVPRGVTPKHNDTFLSMSLDEFEGYVKYADKMNSNILVDIANGHMERLHTLCKEFIKNRKSNKIKLMVGNIANPKTYKLFSEIGVDYVRVGIGGGSGCLTASNTGVHYPMASLINECYKYKKDHNYRTEIVADGGFRNYDDIIKALMLGADYVMLGGMLNKCLESCSTTKLFNRISISPKCSNYLWEKYPKLRKHMYKHFRGMSTKAVQEKWKRKELKTAEGLVKTNKVEYRLSGWIQNFKDYLASSMSYTNSNNLEEFKDSKFVFITENALKRFNQ
jgi:isopentenyl diphosphate isomerase/L-lactate dehydrogenase-like FMN-dependent dehydrogenase